MKAMVKRYFVGFDQEFNPGETVDLSKDKIDKLNSSGLGIILDIEEDTDDNGDKETSKSKKK